jgi:hypothetical protein
MMCGCSNKRSEIRVSETTNWPGQWLGEEQRYSREEKREERRGKREERRGKREERRGKRREDARGFKVQGPRVDIRARTRTSRV